jgi:hypothetical protein
MRTVRADGPQPAGTDARDERPRWVGRLGLVALTLLIVVALVAMEILSLLLLDLLR